MKSLVDTVKKGTGAADFSATPVGGSKSNVDWRNALEHEAIVIFDDQNGSIEIEHAGKGRQMQFNSRQLGLVDLAILENEPLCSRRDGVSIRRGQLLSQVHLKIAGHFVTPVAVS